MSHQKLDHSASLNQSFCAFKRIHVSDNFFSFSSFITLNHIRHSTLWSFSFIARSHVASHNREKEKRPNEQLLGRFITSHSDGVLEKGARPHWENRNHRNGHQTHETSSVAGQKWQFHRSLQVRTAKSTFTIKNWQRFLLIRVSQAVFFKFDL